MNGKIKEFTALTGDEDVGKVMKVALPSTKRMIKAGFTRNDSDDQGNKSGFPYLQKKNTRVLMNDFSFAMQIVANIQYALRKEQAKTGSKTKTQSCIKKMTEPNGTIRCLVSANEKKGLFHRKYVVNATKLSDSLDNENGFKGILKIVYNGYNDPDNKSVEDIIKNLLKTLKTKAKRMTNWIMNGPDTLRAILGILEQTNIATKGQLTSAEEVLAKLSEQGEEDTSTQTNGGSPGSITKNEENTVLEGSNDGEREQPSLKPIDQIKKSGAERVEKRLKIIKKNKELAESGKPLAKDLTINTPKITIIGLALKNPPPYAAFHLYRDKNTTNEGKILFPFPRTNDKSSYGIIKKIIEINKENPKIFSVKNESGIPGVIFRSEDDLYDTLYGMYEGEECNINMLNDKESLKKYFKAELLDKDVETDDLKVYVQIQTGRGFALEGTPGIDRYYECIHDFAWNVVYELLRGHTEFKNNDNYIIYMYKKETMPKDLSIYKASLKGETKYLFTAEKDEQKLKEMFMDIFLQGKIDDHIATTETGLINWIIEKTTIDSNYLKELPGCLKDVKNIMIDQKAFEMKDSEELKKKREHTEQMRKEQEMEAKEQDYMSKLRPNSDIAFEVFKKIYPGQKFTESFVEGEIKYLKSVLFKDDSTGLVNKNRFFILINIQNSVEWNTTFLTFFWKQLAQKSSYEELKNSSKTIYDAFKDERAKNAFRFLVTVGFSTKNSKGEISLNEDWLNKSVVVESDDIIKGIEARLESLNESEIKDSADLFFLSGLLFDIARVNSFSDAPVDIMKNIDTYQSFKFKEFFITAYDRLDALKEANSRNSGLTQEQDDDDDWGDEGGGNDGSEEEYSMKQLLAQGSGQGLVESLPGNRG